MFSERVQNFKKNGGYVADSKVAELVRDHLFDQPDLAKRKRCMALLDCFKAAMIACSKIPVPRRGRKPKVKNSVQVTAD